MKLLVLFYNYKYKNTSYLKLETVQIKNFTWTLQSLFIKNIAGLHL